MALKVSMLGLSPEINIWTGGPVMKGDVVAVDTETLLIDMEAPWIYPEVVVLTAYGGGSTVDLVTWEHIQEYVTKLLKRKCILAFHNAPFDLGVLGMDQFVEHIENGLIVDTGLQWVLRKLSTQGISDENREYPGLARVVYDLFHEKMDKDEGVRLTFNRGMDLDDAHQIYACGDAVATWRAAMLMGPQPTMATQVKGFLTMDFISRTGFLVDKDYMRETRNIHLKKMDEAANRLMSWGIKAAKDPETSDIWKWMVEELELVLPAESAQKLPVTLARNILHFSLGASSVHEVAEWLKAPEFTSALLDPTERMPFAKGALTKRQAFGCLWKVLNNLMDLKPPSEGLQDYWESHEGWPAGYKERSSTAILQDLMVEAEKSLGIKLPRTDGGSTGKRKMAINEEALATLDDETLKQLPFLESWKDYAHAQNMVSTYLDEKILWNDGRIHPRFCPLMATGRVSSRAPNVQNPPKEERMREHYIADPGYVLNSCDYSQQELVCLAQDCYTEYGFSTMRDLINHDIDLHGYIGTRIDKRFEGLPPINGEDEDLMNRYKEIINHFKEEDKGKFKFLRSLSKALNFGLPGGLGPKTFINYAKGYGVTVSLEEAKVLCALWKSTFPEMERHLSPEPMMEIPDRYISRILTGRLRVNCSFCAACNTKFQGLASDISKEAGWALYREGFSLSSFIHDEYIALIPFDRNVTARTLHMQNIMETTMRRFTPDVKCKAEPTLMFRWSKAAELWVDGEGDIIPWEWVPLEEKEGKVEVVPWERMSKEDQKVLVGRKHDKWNENERMFTCGKM